MVTGDSGSGKTGLLSTLANAGYRTCILDLDDGLDILSTYLTPKGAENIHFMTLSDGPEGSLDAWGKFVRVISNGWKDDGEDLGKIESWGTDTVFVIDTLNFLGKASMRHILGRAGKAFDDWPTRGDWGEAARKMEHRIGYICSKAISCHVVVNTHIRTIEDDYGKTKSYPSVIGSALSENVGGYFNTLLRIDTKLTKEGYKRILRTTSDHRMDLKTSSPTEFETEEAFDLANIIKKNDKNAVGSK